MDTMRPYVTTPPPRGGRDTHGSSNPQGIASSVVYPRIQPGWQSIYIRCWQNPIILLALVALGLMVTVFVVAEIYKLPDGGAGIDAIIIAVAIVLATLLEFHFALLAARQGTFGRITCDEPTFTTLREGRVQAVALSALQVGDEVHLQAGDLVPGDGILLEADLLQIDETTIGGPSLIEKAVDASNPDAGDVTLRQGSVVVNGSARLRLTHVERIRTCGGIDVGRSNVATDLSIAQQRVIRVVRSVVRILLFVALPILFITSIVYHLYAGTDLTVPGWIVTRLPIFSAFVLAALPFAVPMGTWFAAAYVFRKLHQAGCMVLRRREASRIGRITCFCADTHGIFTENRMRVEGVYTPLGNAVESDDPLAFEVACGLSINTSAHYANDSERVTPRAMGSPTEGALLDWVEKRGEDYRKIRDNAQVYARAPFSPTRRYMATLASIDGARQLFVKGDPDTVIAYCSTAWGEGGELVPLEQVRLSLTRTLGRLQAQGYSILAIASCDAPVGRMFLKQGAIVYRNLRLIALVAISDPVRHDAAEAVSLCREAGLSVKIVTGGTLYAAREVAFGIGLLQPNDAEGRAIAGPAFRALPDLQASEVAKKISILYQAEPMDKQRLVSLLQQRGDRVAFATANLSSMPALREAHFAIALQLAPAAIRFSSHIALRADSLSSLLKAYRWGYAYQGNVQRLTAFQLSINVATCAIILVASLAGFQNPFSMPQLLYFTFLFPLVASIAIATTQPLSTFMPLRENKKRRLGLNPAVAREIVTTSSLLFGILAFQLYMLAHIEIDVTTGAYISDLFKLYGPILYEGVHPGLTPYERSLFFYLFALVLFWVIVDLRVFASPHHSLYRIRQDKLFALFALSLFFVSWMVASFGSSFLGVVPLGAHDQIWLFVLSTLVIIGGELIRRTVRVFRIRSTRWGYADFTEPSTPSTP